MALRCPICNRPRNEFPLPAEHLPFCSKRCRQADLGHWLDEDYRVSRPLRPTEFELVEEDFDLDSSPEGLDN